VVLENIQRRADLGEPPMLAALNGGNQVIFAVLATTAVLVAVFVPLIFLPGVIGRVFVELAITISGAVLLSRSEERRVGKGSKRDWSSDVCSSDLWCWKTSSAAPTWASRPCWPRSTAATRSSSRYWQPPRCWWRCSFR